MKLSTTSVLTHLNENKSILRAFYFLFLVALIVLFFDTKDNGHDFEVMWRAAHHFLTYQPIYSIPRDGGMVFKYPPWFVFFFIPFGFLPMGIAKIAWAAVSAGSLAGVFYILRQMGFSVLSLAISFLSFWGIWAVHFIDGQSEVVILFLFLLLLKKAIRSPIKSTAAIGFLMSIKGPSVFGSLGVLNKKIIFKACALLGVITIALTGIVILTSTHEAHILSDWKEAAVSGSSKLEPGKALVGRDNQGFSALIHRVRGEVSKEPFSEMNVNGAVLGIGFVLFSILFFNLLSTERAFFWLAGSVVIHPLCWFHLYVWTLPFVVWITDRAIKRQARWVWILFPFLVGAVTERTFGTLGKILEFYSFKAVIVCVALVWFSIEQKRSLRV